MRSLINLYRESIYFLFIYQCQCLRLEYTQTLLFYYCRLKQNKSKIKLDLPLCVFNTETPPINVIYIFFSLGSNKNKQDTSNTLDVAIVRTI